MVNLSAADFARKKNKHLLPIAEWVAGHGGGAVIPFSVEWEQQWHDLRDDEAARTAFQAATGGAKSALPRAIVTSYKDLDLVHFFTAGAAGSSSKRPQPMSQSTHSFPSHLQATRK